MPFDSASLQISFRTNFESATDVDETNIALSDIEKASGSIDFNWC